MIAKAKLSYFILITILVYATFAILFASAEQWIGYGKYYKRIQTRTASVKAIMKTAFHKMQLNLSFCYPQKTVISPNKIRVMKIQLT